MPWKASWRPRARPCRSSSASAGGTAGAPACPTTATVLGGAGGAACDPRYSVAAGSGRLGGRGERHFVPIRGLDAQQIVDEVIVAVMLAAQYGNAVILPGDIQHVEMLVGLDQSVDHLQRRSWVDVGIHLADDDQRPALQL